MPACHLAMLMPACHLAVLMLACHVAMLMPAYQFATLMLVCHLATFMPACHLDTGYILACLSSCFPYACLYLKTLHPACQFACWNFCAVILRRLYLIIILRTSCLPGHLAILLSTYHIATILSAYPIAAILSSACQPANLLSTFYSILRPCVVSCIYNQFKIDPPSPHNPQYQQTRREDYLPSLPHVFFFSV